MSSQYEEDKIIADFFGDYVGTFLDLGAGDGQLCSNTEELAKRGWDGWCVEPHAESFSALRKFYKDNKRVGLIQGAVSGDGRVLEFFHHDGQISTGLIGVAVSHNLPGDAYWIPTLSVKQICTMLYHLKIDFVSLDCEGMDQEIASQGARLFRDVRLLCYEHDLPCQPSNDHYTAAWKMILDSQGFTKVVGKTDGNTLVTRP